MVAWSGVGSSWVLCRTMEAANWLMSWDSLRVRLGMCPVSQVGRRRQACGNSKDPTTNLCIPASSPGDAVSYRPLPGPYEECRRDIIAILIPHPAQSVLIYKSADDETTGIQEPSAVTRRSEERRVGKECRSRWSPY